VYEIQARFTNRVKISYDTDKEHPCITIELVSRHGNNVTIISDWFQLFEFADMVVIKKREHPPVRGIDFP
jgi:hypothetical protein